MGVPARLPGCSCKSVGPGPQGAIAAHLPNSATPSPACSFLNRMLGMRLDDQRLAFDYFSAALDKVESSYKQMGQYDSGGWGSTRQGGGRAAAGSWG